MFRATWPSSPRPWPPARATNPTWWSFLNCSYRATRPRTSWSGAGSSSRCRPAWPSCGGSPPVIRRRGSWWAPPCPPAEATARAYTTLPCCLRAVKWWPPYSRLSCPPTTCSTRPAISTPPPRCTWSPSAGNAWASTSVRTPGPTPTFGPASAPTPTTPSLPWPIKGSRR